LSKGWQGFGWGKLKIAGVAWVCCFNGEEARNPGAFKGFDSAPRLSLPKDAWNTSLLSEIEKIESRRIIQLAVPYFESKPSR
jgi:hypothetical protein